MKKAWNKDFKNLGHLTEQPFFFIISSTFAFQYLNQYFSCKLQIKFTSFTAIGDDKRLLQTA